MCSSCSRRRWRGSCRTRCSATSRRRSGWRLGLGFRGGSAQLSPAVPPAGDAGGDRLSSGAGVRAGHDAVVVVQNATVLDLKKALRRHVQLRQARRGGVQHLSWKYIWRTYHLTYNGEKLADDGKKLREYGIRNRDEVSFIKKLRK
ncbi:U11/U12 small nuclear ribonucleoprotein 25 kDa protein isoform X1 [Lagopus muta]|uniref:U11/U12 small nuclear ribonucleoprotein 25 kDa protein isoform X1 n=1 Tax=Lagopus muta TaxID=64668 RepID=UPI0020A1C0A8|nr:U11/U12 small nuclear ribonucleoprotein 25 kDa protein isoform X1 [Lagopus muta]XP_048817215.1 U11/U12 small nuclear ribonucleoprotein 25 kDa protein isoform X1 [Lagopus muta]